jgi:lysozyme family protein
MNYSANFLTVVGRHIEIEGGYVCNPHDPGGATKYGISKRYNPDVDIENLTVDQAKEFYYRRYWQPMRLDEIKDLAVVREMFDAGGGPNGMTMAILIAQGALILLGRNVTLDGKIGAQTIGEINRYPYTDVLVKLMNCLQFTALLLGSNNVEEVIGMVRARKTQLREFMRGWMKRIEL